MKAVRIFLYLPLLGYLLGCQSSDTTTTANNHELTASSKEERQRNQQVVEDFFRHLEALDVEAFMALWAEDGQQVMPFAPEGFPDTLRGKEAIYQQYRSLPDNYRSMEFPREIIPMKDPNQWLARYRGIIPLRNGGQYNNHYVALFELEAGKIKTYYEYFNPIILQEAFGEGLQDNFNTSN